MEFKNIEYCIIHLSSGESFPVLDTSSNILDGSEAKFKTFKELSSSVIDNRKVTIKIDEIIAIEDVSREDEDVAI